MIKVDCVPTTRFVRKVWISIYMQHNIVLCFSFKLIFILVIGWIVYSHSFSCFFL